MEPSKSPMIAQLKPAEDAIRLKCPHCGHSWLITRVEWDGFKFLPDCLRCGKRGMMRVRESP